MIQFYAPISTVLLATAAFHWSQRGALNKAVQFAMVAATVFGAVVTAKALPFGL